MINAIFICSLIAYCTMWGMGSYDYLVGIRSFTLWIVIIAGIVVFINYILKRKNRAGRSPKSKPLIFRGI
jgi:uncharacterized membrane protein